MMTLTELAARLTLRALPGLRDRAIHHVLREHGSAAAALCAPSQLIDLGAHGLPDARVRARVDDAMHTIERLGVSVLCADQPGYPKQVLQRLRSRAPSMLFALGDTALLTDIGIALVGSRKMSEYGRGVAEDFSRDLSHAGLCIVSGLARGIDSVAHDAALDAGGDTIAVVGNGVDVIYPPENGRLRARIAEHGLVISQFLPGDRPLKHNFPERNLLMATLTEGVLVIEAGAQSGASITAHHAADHNVEAMVIPGPIGRDSNKGSNQLIREGAACVTSVGEVIEAMDRPGRPDALKEQLQRRHERRVSRVARLARSSSARHASETGAEVGVDDATIAALFSSEAMSVRAALDGGARHIDNIASTTGLTMRALMGVLLDLELAGVVRQHPGARYELRSGNSTTAAGYQES